MRLFSFSYWFSHPFGVSGGIYVYVTLTLLLFILAVVTRYYWKAKGTSLVIKKYLKPFPAVLFWFGVVALLFTFFRYEDVYIFSSRIWVLIILGAFIWWLIPKALAFKKNYKQDLEEAGKAKEANRYKPKRKKK